MSDIVILIKRQRELQDLEFILLALHEKTLHKWIDIT